jgi:hypothetical protein
MKKGKSLMEMQEEIISSQHRIILIQEAIIKSLEESVRMYKELIGKK